MDKRVERILFTKSQIDAAIKKCAQWIDKQYKNEPVLLVGILKGVVPFFGHLVVNMKSNVTIDFMTYSSYHGNVKATGKPKIVMDLKNDIKGKNVVIVEDIIDTGKTLKAIYSILKKRNPKSLKVVTLLDKHEARTVDFEPDYVCWQVPNLYIVGFGFDYDEKMRNLPYIGILKKSIYNNNLKTLRGKKERKC